MNWTKILAYSLGLSFAFFLYFGYLVADKWSLWAIREIGPLLRVIKTEYGQSYSRALGHSVAFIAGTLFTTAFFLPLCYAFPSGPKLLASVLIIIAPVMLVSAGGTDISASGIASLMEPLAGAALAVFTIKLGRPRP